MGDQRWQPGACVLFAVVMSLALWTVLILLPFIPSLAPSGEAGN